MVAIFVVLTILVLVSIDAGIERARRRRLAKAGAPESFPALRRIQGMAEGLALPMGLFVHRGHTWAEVYPSGSVRVGLDDFARRALGRLDGVAALRPGERVAQGEAMLTLEQGGRRVGLPAPVSGVIEAVNEALLENPETLEKDPYRKGWAYVLRPSRLGQEVQGLKVGEAARAWLEEEARRFADWVTGLGATLAMTMPDGGTPVVGALAYLDDAAWGDFQRRFLGDPVVHPQISQISQIG
jgi:glycine cleavage system H protein